MGNLRALKLLLFASVALHSYGVPVFVNDVTGIVIAFCCIVAGFLAEMRMKRKYKALRVCGLVLVLLCVVNWCSWTSATTMCCSGRRDFLSEASFALVSV